MAAALSSNSYLDCRSANQQAIDSINDGVRNGYVPECDSYGGYKPVQCYKVRYTLQELKDYTIRTVWSKTTMITAGKER